MTADTFTEAILHEYTRSTQKDSPLLQKIQKAALTRFKLLREENTKSELFSYVDLSGVFANAYQFVNDLEIVDLQLEDTVYQNCERVVLVNGRLSEKYSDYADENLEVLPLCDMDARMVEDFCARYAGESDFLALLSGLFMREGVFIRVRGNLARPLCLVEYSQGSAAREGKMPLVAPCVCVQVEEGAVCQIVHECLAQGSLYNAGVWNIALQKNAQLEYLCVQQNLAEMLQLSKLWVKQDTKSVFRALVVGGGGVLSRWNYEAHLGKESVFSAHILHVLAETKNAHWYFRVYHDFPGAESQQYFRNIFMGQSEASIDSTVHVQEGAYHTNSEQMIQNLMLSDHATINMKPNLQIHADDVKCAHGATLGQIQEKDLFYCMSRGLSESQAKRLLVEGFIEEFLAQIHNKAFLERIKGSLQIKDL